MFCSNESQHMLQRHNLDVGVTQKKTHFASHSIRVFSKTYLVSGRQSKTYTTSVRYGVFLGNHYTLGETAHSTGELSKKAQCYAKNTISVSSDISHAQQISKIECVVVVPKKGSLLPENLGVCLKFQIY